MGAYTMRACVWDGTRSDNSIKPGEDQTDILLRHNSARVFVDSALSQQLRLKLPSCGCNVSRRHNVPHQHCSVIATPTGGRWPKATSRSLTQLTNTLAPSVLFCVRVLVVLTGTVTVPSTLIWVRELSWELSALDFKCSFLDFNAVV